MQPAIAITFAPCFLANFATPIGALPIAVWLSNLPSPVITKSASFITSSNFISSNIIFIPDSSLEFKNAKNPNPNPPAAPTPATLAISLPKSFFTTSAKFIRPLSNSSTISLVAPFCGPYICAAPFSPYKGLLTSHAILKLHSSNSFNLLSIFILFI